MMMMMMFQHGCSYVLVGDLHGKLRLCDRMLGCGTDGDIYLMATCNDTTWMKQMMEKGGGQARPLPSGGHGVELNGGSSRTDSGVVMS
jgi:hypothetical protein